MSGCLLIPVDGQEDLLTRLRQTHQPLLQGLSGAQHLEVFKVTALDDNNGPHIARLLAGQFLLNPAARTLCILDSAGANFEPLVSQANAKRARDGLTPVELKTDPETASEDDDDSDLLATLVEQYGTADYHATEEDGMEIDDQQDDDQEEDERTDDDMRDESDG